MDTDQISIKFFLEVTTWQENQTLDLVFYLDDVLLGEKQGVAGDIEANFDAVSVLDQGNSTLSIKISGMQQSYTQVSDTGEIVNDVLCVIKNVELDEIALDNLVYSQSTYIPEYPDQTEGPKILNNETHLGHNGTWNLTFSNPLYLWFIENM